MATGFFFILGIILSGIMCIVSLVMAIITFAYSKNSKFYWLTGFLLSVAALVACILLTINRVAHKASNFVKKMEQDFAKMIPDSASMAAYNYSDSLNSPQVKALKEMESPEVKGKVPAQFYHYLGFRDYYRLPLSYPFSIHCIETPGVGDLYDETMVERFDANNNGEKECNLKNIVEFAFDTDHILAKCLHNSGKNEEFRFFIYDLKSGKSEEFRNAIQMNRRAAELNFRGNRKLVSCEKYFEKF